jgi:hypothetical protein
MQLDKKSRMRFISCTGQNPMRFNDRLVYSKLVFLQRKNKGASFKKLRRETGLNLQRTIPRIVQRLVTWGLAEDKDGCWWAKEPPVPDWFGWVRDQDRPWWERLAYWWLYLPGRGLALNEAAVWSLLWSFGQTGRKLRIGKLHLLLKLDAKRQPSPLAESSPRSPRKLEEV